MIEERFKGTLGGGSRRGAVALAAALALAFGTLGFAVPAFAYERATASVPVTVAVSGDAESDNPSFTVSAVGRDAASTSALDRTSLTFDGDGEGSFTVSASEPTEYVYTVSQSAGAPSGWDVDKRSYQVVVQFWNDGTDTLTPHVFVSGLDDGGRKSGATDVCAFENSHKGSGSVGAGSSGQRTSEQGAPVTATAGRTPSTSDPTRVGLVPALVALGVALVCSAVLLERRRRRGGLD